MKVATPEEARKFLKGEPVAKLTGHEFEGVRGMSALVTAICESYSRVGGSVCHPQLGRVSLTRAGTNDSLRHGFGRLKLAAFAALPEIVANGQIVQQTENWKERGYDSYVLASPLSIGDEPCCAFVVVNRMVNGDKNYYLHEVARLREIEKAEELRSSLSSRGGKVGSPFGLVRSLAYSIFGVNGVEMPEREIGE